MKIRMLFAALLFVSALPSWAGSETTFLKIVQGDAPGLIRAEVHLQDVSGIKAYGANIMYDPAQYALVSTDNGPLLSGGASPLFIKTNNDGKAMAAGARVETPQGVSGSGVIATFTFRRIGSGTPVPSLSGVKVSNISGEVLNIREIPAPTDKPIKVVLGQNFPNPFNPETTIPYALPEDGRITLVIYNALGQAVRTLVDGNVPADSYSVRWDSRDDAGRIVSSGVYFYRLTAAGKHKLVQKMILLK